MASRRRAPVHELSGPSDQMVRRAGRVALVAWAAIGVAVLAFVALAVLSALRVVVLPLVLATFPAIVLAPVYRRVRSVGAPPALASLACLTGLLGVLVLIGFTSGRAAAGQLDDLGDRLERGYDRVRSWLANDSPLMVDLGPPEELADRLRLWASDGNGLGFPATSVIGTTIETVTGALLLFVFAFFYLKDGRRLIQWLPSSLPPPWSRRLEEASEAAWHGISAFLRGQLIVAAVDAVAIGVGLVVLGVPLALPLAALVFFGGFFPIIGATLSGLVAALVALADGGVSSALSVVVLVVVVQQLEGNVLEPYIVGRATQLHPMIVILALAAGGALAGLLGAFLGVPIAAAAAAIVRYAIAERNTEHVDVTSAVDENGEPGASSAVAGAEIVTTS